MPRKRRVGWKKSGESAGPSTAQTPVVPLTAQQQVETAQQRVETAQQRVETAQQQVETAQQQVEPPTAIDPSTAPLQDAHVQELHSEVEIVRQFYQPTKISGEVTNDQESEEITMYRYFINNEVKNSWADGELSTYCFLNRKWGNRIAVKFYILEDLSEEEAEKISQKVDALLSMPSYTNVFTPIFQVYNVRVKRVILCYPPFDLHLGDWLQSNTEVDTLQHAGQNLLLPIWINFIRDILSCIEPVDKMAISKFGDLSSYVWKAQSKCIKIILFPFEKKTIGVETVLAEFAELLTTQIRSHWLHPELLFELDLFISFLKLWPKKPEGIPQFWVNLSDNPLLQDYDGISSLIRMTWRQDPLPYQITELKANITQPDGHLSWLHVDIKDPVMKLMLSKGQYSNDPASFFTFIKKVAAHYPQNYREYGGLDPNGQRHPISVIKDTYPRVICQIYMLSKKKNWLE